MSTNSEGDGHNWSRDALLQLPRIKLMPLNSYLNFQKRSLRQGPVNLSSLFGTRVKLLVEFCAGWRKLQGLRGGVCPPSPASPALIYDHQLVLHQRRRSVRHMHPRSKAPAGKLPNFDDMQGSTKETHKRGRETPFF